MNGARTAIAASLAAAALLLAGCDADGDGIDDQTGQPVTTHQTGTTGGDCAGWGPLSGCGTGRSQTRHADHGVTPADGVNRSDLADTARHEAGHVAAAREYGWTVLSVRIRPDSSGRTNIAGFGFKDPQQRLVVLYAGFAAAPATEGRPQGHDGDETQANRILDRYPPAEAERMEATARAEAERIVLARAGQIDRDAATLLRDGRL